MQNLKFCNSLDFRILWGRDQCGSFLFIVLRLVFILLYYLNFTIPKLDTIKCNVSIFKQLQSLQPVPSMFRIINSFVGQKDCRTTWKFLNLKCTRHVTRLEISTIVPRVLKLKFLNLIVNLFWVLRWLSPHVFPFPSPTFVC